jgi:hypothetical protein
MSDEKMRDEFEEWAGGIEFGLKAGHFVKDGSGEYVNYPTQCYWMVWQAARAAMVVELPVKVTQANGFASPEDDEYYNLAIDHCSRQIAAAGITVKQPDKRYYPARSQGAIVTAQTNGSYNDGCEHLLPESAPGADGRR